MIANRKTSLIFIVLAIVSLFIMLLYQIAGIEKDTLALLQTISDEIASYENIGDKYPLYNLYDKEENLLAYGALTQASAYGGPMTILTGFDPEGQIIAVEIIEEYETPHYLHRVLSSGYLEEFENKSLKNSFKLGQDLDAISGATITTEAIAVAVEKASHELAVLEFGMTKEKYSRINFGLDEIILILLFAIILYSQRKRTLKARTYVMVFSTFFIGFKLNASINLGNFASLISANAPFLLERPFWYILIVGTLLIVLVTGRNYYCTWLCPYGAVQEGINRSLGLVKIQIPRNISKHAQKIRLFLTWLALMLAFAAVNPSLASYEPFSAFFSGQANAGQWILMVISLLLAILINRFWCRFFCPTGAILDLVAAIKSLFKKNLLDKNKDKDKPIHRLGEEKELDSDKFKQPNKNKPLFVSLLLVFTILVIYTLLIDSGLF